MTWVTEEDSVRLKGVEAVRFSKMTYEKKDEYIGDKIGYDNITVKNVDVLDSNGEPTHIMVNYFYAYEKE